MNTHLVLSVTPVYLFTCSPVILPLSFQSLESTRRMMQLVEEVTTQHHVVSLELAPRRHLLRLTG